MPGFTIPTVSLFIGWGIEGCSWPYVDGQGSPQPVLNAGLHPTQASFLRILHLTESQIDEDVTCD